MFIECCAKCEKKLYEGDVASHLPHTDWFICHECYKKDQPERLNGQTPYIRGCESLNPWVTMGGSAEAPSRCAEQS